MTSENIIETVETETATVETETVVREMTQAEIDAMTSAVNANAILVSVSVHAFGLTRKVRADRATIDGATVRSEGANVAEGEIAARHVTVSKKLLSCEEYQEIKTLDGRFYSMMMGRVISTKYRKGSYLLPVTLLDWFEEQYAAYLAERARLIDSFLAVYSQAIDDAQSALGPLFEQSDYPVPARVRESFAVERSYQSIGIPDHLAQVSPTLYQQQKAQLQKATEDAALEARLVLRQGLVEMVAHLRDRLEPNPDGSKKRLHASTIEGLEEWLGLFTARDITGDQELAGVVGSLREIMSGVDQPLLKRSDDVREQVLGALNAAGALVEGMIEEMPTRAFAFDLE